MYREYKQLDLPRIGKEVLEFWKSNNIFEKSISSRPADNPYTFYEGPPSANGMPGIHHVMARSVKDIFCRYKTLKGYQVKRKGGWDTHGLPIELAVEKSLGITKDDIGKKISIEDYNSACRKEVMKYTDVWNDLTEKMGYWVDLQNPYVTYENEYIETLWWILKQFYNKDLLYKGYTVQPYSPKAGTGLSSHELNQPGTYRMLKDTSIVAQFHLKNDQQHLLMDTLFESKDEDTVILAWTTTPWTLPSNCALAVGDNINYVKIKTFNPYTFNPVSVVLAKDLVSKYFKADKELPNSLSLGERRGEASLPVTWDGKGGAPWVKVADFKGKDLLGLRYHQLMPYVTNEDLERNAFRVIPADFVTTEDGTGIVHTASVFGADDFRACKENNVPSVMVHDETGKEVPLVDKQGKFVDEVTDFAGRYVKEEYYSDEERNDPNFKPTDVLIAIKLKEEDKAFDVKKYEHSYPHCWRTDKPILYYPLDSWFVRTTSVKDKMVELNKTINWKPESTGTGRFGNWLENLVDWNLSRSRFWGTPLPIWREENGTEEKCVGSIAELKEEIERSIAAGMMPEGFDIPDLHRPYVDDVVLVSSGGRRMLREPDLIDVWFDSGAMPYAQWHFPFENKEAFENAYPADFIAEGVDQTRGWFFTLHAIAVMLSEASNDVKAVNQKVGNKGIAFKNVVSNGLVLDKNGNKMSKRLGNAVDPFETIDTFSADAARWYMISNASPWDNLKFNIEGVDEVRRKFFGTLYNTYSFFSLYANIDGFNYSEADFNAVDRPEIDRWIISVLNTLTKEVDGFYNDFEPTKAARTIQEFVDEHLSNWYVRLSRRRFWRSDNSQDKISAYQTLYTCLVTVSKLMSPIAPFFAERLFTDLNSATRKENVESVHLATFPTYHADLVDQKLEERMHLAQDVSSLVLSLRKKVGINVRQPLSRVLLPVLDNTFQSQVDLVKELILSETNVKDIEYITDTAGLITKKIKPNFKALGPKVGKDMKSVSEAITQLTQADISTLESTGEVAVLDGRYTITTAEVEIIAEDVPGWQVASLGKLTVALDIHISDELKQEGTSRELINRVQNLRKTKGFEVTDKIKVVISDNPVIAGALQNNLGYICAEILADTIQFDSSLAGGDVITIDDIEIRIAISKV
ncbi:isoleucine--tRNA ligase [Mucilaginibacter ginkgonis]|uniref:Isoleucine--tRNA ligase n=1 Tax=Mucilaginibacter ginkgonis TaxID=2682091 RepID=A0A6I4I206_9SPHI|nr:isoleucine--tRNA ligase [Mucilaginibacter ginkgonis]QQL49272.1 isoleucine--tRNA ligase [Mucilaginibacter ginkgonis]